MEVCSEFHLHERRLDLRPAMKVGSELRIHGRLPEFDSIMEVDSEFHLRKKRLAQEPAKARPAAGLISKYVFQRQALAIERKIARRSHWRLTYIEFWTFRRGC